MLHLQEGEHIDIKARKHWFLLFSESFGLFFLYILPFFGWSFFMSQSPIVLPAIHESLPIFLASIWTLLFWAKLFSVWTEYYLDIWIVTDRRIVNIEQKTLFRREVSTLRMERVQDVTLETNGIIATVLGFGDVVVQTAGETREFVIKGVDNPERVKRKILEHLDARTY